MQSAEVPTVLITGGSGYLGSHLVRLAHGSWHVAATYLSHPVPLPVDLMAQVDIRDSSAVARCVAEVQPQAIIHTAYDQSSPDAMQASIVDGTRHVADIARDSGARLVYLSSDMVFDGEHSPYREDHVPQPISRYGQAKAEAERLVSELCPAVAIVRTSLIYGFYPPDPRSLRLLDSLRHGRPITLFTDEIRCPVWVEQLATAILELAARGLGGVWHLAGPQPLSRLDFGERLALAYGLNPAGLTPGLSRSSPTIRPRDLTLDVSKAQSHLRSPLWGVDAVLSRWRSAGGEP